MAFHLHPAVLPITAVAALALVLFKVKKARASVSDANAQLRQGLAPAQPAQNLLLPSSADPTQSNMNDYMAHLQNAVANTAVLHSDLTAQAQATNDPNVMASATHTILQADADLKAPMDTLTVQRDLNVLGASPALKEDGIMGSKSTAALKDFQGKMLLAQTGKLDPQTASALRRAVAAVLQANANAAGGTSTSGPAPATRGLWSSIADAFGLSSDVMNAYEVQTSLNALGATPRLKEDGIKGPLTTQAIKDFQTHQGLKADGIVGPETASALRYYVAAVTPQLQQYVTPGVTPVATAGGFYDAEMAFTGFGGGHAVSGYGYPVAGYTSQSW